ncbi:hypothetical protein [Plantibacter sp. CFBP 8775]|uniref:hypothetical protein n=1 Tax=Plantibacter sp. CFBP 8775 TaxID=2774038 RepID=UPI0017849DDA|nr:hypothetical protein [Plantibacter sp. CFBP 8775]MBD8104356.1 hypothetical protein [Plantibacter sp. CFBP 8775]
MRNSWNRGLRLLAAPVVVVALLSGCAGPAADLDASTGRDLQSRVLVVANAAADGDTAGALAALDALEAQLAAAEAAGTVSATRAADIRAAIARVRADLSPAVETPAPTPEPSSVAPVEPVSPVEDDGGGDDSGNNGNNGNNGNKGNNGNNGKDKKDK